MRDGKVVLRCDSGDPETIDRLMHEMHKQSLTSGQAKVMKEMFFGMGGIEFMRNGEYHDFGDRGLSAERDSDARYQ